MIRSILCNNTKEKQYERIEFMIKRIMMNLSIVLCLMFCQIVFAAGAAQFFNVSSTGTPGNVNIILCLNGKGPLTCQHYNVSALTLNINTISVGIGPGAIAITPNKTEAYVANNNDNTISVINTATNAVNTTILVGSQPDGIAII
jgi:YVTN family beta-propeller protein